MIGNATNPALTYTLSDFIELGSQDDMTYENFAILRVNENKRFIEQNILDLYMPELRKICSRVDEFTADDIRKYRYFPDLLAYDIYGTTQLDFIVMICNGIIDPKEFDFHRKYLMLPKKTILKEFLSAVYNSERDWISMNRTEIQQNSQG